MRGCQLITGLVFTFLVFTFLVCCAASETDCEGRPAASTCLLTKTSATLRSEHVGESSQSLWEDVGESNLLIEDEEAGGRLHEPFSQDSKDSSLDSSFTSSFWSLLHRVLRSILVALFLHLAMLLVKRRTGSEPVTEPDSCTTECTEWKVKPVPVETSSGPSGFVDFCSALHVAAAEANVEDLQRLLKGTKGTSGSEADVNAVDAWDETALHMAARRGSIEACELLIEAKADVNAVNANDETPLMVTGAGCVSFCHLLLQHGAHLGVPVTEDAVPSSCATALVESLLTTTTKD